MTIPRQHGSVNLETKPTKRRSEDVDYSPITNRIIKVQKEEYLIKNACYSPAKYYLCKQNNKRSFFSSKQRSQVARSFLNRYLFSCANKVTSLFSIRYTLINILACHSTRFIMQNAADYTPICPKSYNSIGQDKSVFASSALDFLSPLQNDMFAIIFKYPCHKIWLCRD